MRTANPALNKNSFANLVIPKNNTEHMTIDGTVNKTLLMLVLLMFPAAYMWTNFFSGNMTGFGMLWAGLIGGLVFALITIFKKEWAPYTAPAYAICEGLLLGTLSAVFEAMYPGLVIQAVGLTFGTLLTLLFVYKSGLIPVTQNFRMGIFAATGGIFFIYLINIILSFFGLNIPFVHSNGWFGILFSLFVVIIAALNLVLDFDFIERAAKHKAPKYMEWYGAFGLMVTLIWLYVEILRLLAKLRSR